MNPGRFQIGLGGHLLSICFWRISRLGNFSCIPGTVGRRFSQRQFCTVCCIDQRPEILKRWQLLK
jgi:hypothetical protein